MPSGKLPVFSCDTEQQAKDLLTLACETNINGEFIARELASEQTAKNLQEFSDRLQHIWDVMQANQTEQA